MTDREKVIKGLECCTRYEVGKQLNNCLDCPYVEPIGFNQFRCKSQEMKEDALALLKEQEMKLGKWITKIRHEHYPSGKQYEEDFCSVCGKRGSLEYQFCPNCGAKMEGR